MHIIDESFVLFQIFFVLLLYNFKVIYAIIFSVEVTPMEKNMEYIYQIYLDGSFSQAAKEIYIFPSQLSARS